MRRRLRYLRFQFHGRGGSWLALLGQLIAVVGLPLPAGAKDLSQPFPCQHRQCGCMSARDCWKSCCCFTAATRVAWAEAHGVIPPVELVAEAEDEQPCCEAEQKPCCAKHPVKKTPAAPKKNERGTPAPSSGGWTLVIQAKRCHGPAGADGAATPTAPPGLPQVWRFEWALVAWVPATALTAVQRTHLPLAPPPRA